MPRRLAAIGLRRFCLAMATPLVLSLLVAGTATADIFFEDFDKNRNNPPYQFYLQGVADGIAWANSIGRNEGHGLLCPPDKMAITPEQYLDILDRYMRDHPGGADYRGMSLVLALKETFPCP